MLFENYFFAFTSGEDEVPVFLHPTGILSTCSLDRLVSFDFVNRRTPQDPFRAFFSSDEPETYLIAGSTLLKAVEQHREGGVYLTIFRMVHICDCEDEEEEEEVRETKRTRY